MVFEHAQDHASPWAAITSIAEKIGCAAENVLDSLEPRTIAYHPHCRGADRRWPEPGIKTGRYPASTRTPSQ